MELQIPAVHEKQRNVRPEILFYRKLLSCEKIILARNKNPFIILLYIKESNSLISVSIYRHKCTAREEGCRCTIMIMLRSGI